MDTNFLIYPLFKPVKRLVPFFPHQLQLTPTLLAYQEDVQKLRISVGRIVHDYRIFGKIDRYATLHTHTFYFIAHVIPL